MGAKANKFLRHRFDSASLVVKVLARSTCQTSYQGDNIGALVLFSKLKSKSSKLTSRQGLCVGLAKC